MKIAELIQERKKRKRKKPFMWMGLPYAIVQSGTGEDTVGYGAEAVSEEKARTPVRHGIKEWPEEFYLKGGYTAKFREHKPLKSRYIIVPLFSDDIVAYAIILKRWTTDYNYWWLVYDQNTNYQLGVKGVSDAEAFDQKLFADWVATCLTQLKIPEGKT